MRKISAIIAITLISSIALLGCEGKNNSKDNTTTSAVETTEAAEETKEAALADGEYEAYFTTDSKMFHVNETKDGKGTLTVKDGEMTIHVSLASDGITNLFAGLAEDAKKDGAELLNPSVDTMTYDDGTTEDVYGYDIPVPYLDEEFDVAIIGKKGKWYDHKVSVSLAEDVEKTETVSLEDGTYNLDVTLEGGSGKAKVTSPAKVVVKDGKATATVEWSSSHYEYMLIDEVQYDPVNTDGNSTFEIPVTLDTDMEVSALTTAMSEPHLIDYKLHFDSSSAK